MRGVDYASVRLEAQAGANRTGFDYGVEKLGKDFRSFMLPGREYRFGFERRCEVVSCDRLDRCQPGHGPVRS